MPKIYVRVNPRSQISKRHRCATEFTNVWKEIDADAATRAALEEDAYLEVSETPTVLVEVAATVQAAAPEAAIKPITPESNAQQDSADAAQGDSDQAGTASAVGVEDQPTERGPEADASEGLATGDANTTGDNAQAVDAADAGAEGTADTDVEQQANTGEQAKVNPRAEAIKSAIVQLDPNNAEQWLSDGKPVIDAITVLTGFKVLAAERDQAWTQIQAERSAG